MPKDTLMPHGEDMTSKAGGGTQRLKGGVLPFGMKSQPVRKANMVIPASEAAMDCSPKKDTLGDTSRRVSASPFPKADIDYNKR